MISCASSSGAAWSRSAEANLSTHGEDEGKHTVQIRSPCGQKGRRIKLCSEGFDIGRLFAFCVNTSWSLNHSPIRCMGFAAGVAMRVRAGRIAGAVCSSQAPAAGWSRLWTRIEPTFQRFLTDRRRAAYIKIACEDVDVEFGRIGRQFLGAAVVEFEMFDRRGRPSSVPALPQRVSATTTLPALSLVFSAAAQSRKQIGAGRSRTALDRAFSRAVKCTLKADSPMLSSLPVPARYRASGAIRAWRDAWRLADAADSGLARMLADRNTSPMLARTPLRGFLRSSCSIDFRSEDGRTTASLCLTSVIWQAFWARDGALYEPTDALHRLFGCSALGRNLPLSSIVPAVPALAISTPPSMWGHRGGIEAISVFRHRRNGKDDADADSVSVVSVQLWSHGCGDARAWGMEWMEMVIDDPTRPISDAIEDAIDIGLEARWGVGYRGGQPHLAVAERWRGALHYLAKVLLYLSLDDAQVSEERPYTEAPRSFSGLSRYQRAASRAKIELLYDRYLIGPSALCQALPAQGGIGGAHPLRTLWRRGQFRLQSYGHQHTKRKVRFDMPVVIRADGPEADKS